MSTGAADSETATVRYVDEPTVRAVLRWEPLIAAMEQALAALSSGRVLQPVRTMITVEEGKRYLGVMPAVTEQAMGLKAVSFYPGNAGTKVPTILAVVLLFRVDTGEPLAVMDGRVITEMRTAALSAAATKHLAAKDSRILALIGSGVQASAHLAALSQVRKFDEVRVWSPTRAHAQRFGERHGARVAADVASAVKDADVVVTATDAREPILRGAWLKPGCHVNSVGAPRPIWRELDDQVMQSSVLVVDSREAVLEESGDVILSGASIYAEVGEIFAGTKPRPPAGRTTVFKSVGLAVEDVAAARLVYEALQAR
jgi:ornithine cyclodeaminase/alanine dehydrogenase-like protein (mu-crystallin family)